MEEMTALKRALDEINEKRGTAYHSLKTLQEKSLREAAKSDVLSILPTGYGKSLIFECLPRFCADVLGLELKTSCLIVSPLNSIIQEQLRRYGSDALHISPEFIQNLEIHQSLGCDGECICPDHDLIRRFINCQFLFAIGHPEQLLQRSITIALRHDKLQSSLCHIVVDEAHCISKWGQNFRKDYSKLKELRSALPKAKVLALTATASMKTQSDIKSGLAMLKCVTIQKCIRRENIKLTFKKRPNYTEGSEESFRAVIKPYVEELKEKKDSFPRTIVYSTLKWCGSGYEECVRVLSNDEVKQLVSQYHAPCTSQMKEKVTESMGDENGKRMLFATQAYGMGTDSPNISRVVHFGVPKSTETYLQEVGRSGRNGCSADCTLYYNNNDIASNVEGLEVAMTQLCKTNQCRWDFLCEHFGCKEESREPHHSCCDNCAKTCSCAECDDLLLVSAAFDSEESTEAVDVLSSKSGLKQVLIQYCKAENSVTGMPNPTMYTGLSDKLVNDIVNCTDSEEIKVKFAFLRESYLNNIISIVRSYE